MGWSPAPTARAIDASRTSSVPVRDSLGTGQSHGRLRPSNGAIEPPGRLSNGQADVRLFDEIAVNPFVPRTVSAIRNSENYGLGRIEDRVERHPIDRTGAEGRYRHRPGVGHNLNCEIGRGANIHQ